MLDTMLLFVLFHGVFFNLRIINEILPIGAFVMQSFFHFKCNYNVSNWVT